MTFDIFNCACLATYARSPVIIPGDSNQVKPPNIEPEKICRATMLLVTTPT
jgi:hypothetical protein